MQNEKLNLFQRLEESGINVDNEQMSRITHRINEILSYQPKVGVLGKTGTGKSSLCNALFGMDVAPISDVGACTRDVQKVFVDFGTNKNIALVDVPGIGETELRDEEYRKLYNSVIPELDIVLWLIKADDRAFCIEESFFKFLVKPYISLGKPFIIVINQVDKLEPFLEWDRVTHRPSEKQLHNILLKVSQISSALDFPRSKIVSISVNEGYNLTLLVDKMVDLLPDAKKTVLLSEINRENVSQKTKDNALKSLIESIDIWCLEHIPAYPKIKLIVHRIIRIMYQ